MWYTVHIIHNGIALLNHMQTTPNHTNLVKFIGNTKQLVSAQLHDDVINIWAPPFHQTLVDKPLLSQKLSDHEHIRILRFVYTCMQQIEW